MHIKKILVPLDGSDTSSHGLTQAIAMAKDSQATLRLVHIIDFTPTGSEWTSAEAWQGMLDELRVRGRNVLDKAQAQAQAEGVACEPVLVEFPQERIADVIVSQARNHGCNLIAMGSHGRRGFRRFVLGSDAEAVLRSSTVPVLIVPLASTTAAA